MFAAMRAWYTQSQDSRPVNLKSKGMIRNEDELEELLSRPTDRDKAVMHRWKARFLFSAPAGRWARRSRCVRNEREPIRLSLSHAFLPAVKRRMENAGVETFSQI